MDFAYFLNLVRPGACLRPLAAQQNNGHHLALGAPERHAEPAGKMPTPDTVSSQCLRYAACSREFPSAAARTQILILDIPSVSTVEEKCGCLLLAAS